MRLPTLSALVKALAPLFGAVALGALASCGVTVDLTVEARGRAAVSLESRGSAALTSYLNDLRMLDPSVPDPNLGAEALRAQLTPLPGLTGLTVDKAGDRWSARFRLTDQAWAQPELRGFAQWSQVGAEEVLTLRWRPEALGPLSGWNNSPALAALLPRPGQSLSETELRELLTYFLEPYEARPAALLDASALDLKVTLPRPVKSAPGGRIEGRTVQFRVPLLALLSRSEGFEYVIRY